MSKHVVLVALVLFVLIPLHTACGPAPEDESLERLVAPVYNGELDDGHHSVNEISNAEGGNCSSTLIGRRTVLTAAHCIGTPALPMGYISGLYPGITYKVVAAEKHPSYPNHYSPQHDLAVLRLEKNVKGVIPERLSTQVPTLGETITLVGFGIPGNSGLPGSKRKGVTTISEVGTSTVRHTNGMDLPTTCSGDSGGAVFAQRNGAETLIAVVSGGTQPCDAPTGWGVHTRVDINDHYSWIVQQAQGDLYDGEPIDIEPPKVSITSPDGSQEMPPSFTVEVQATDNVGVASVALLVDQKEVGKVTKPPYTFQVKDLPRDYSHELMAIAYDTEELSSSATVSVPIEAGAAFGVSCAADADCESNLCRGGVCTQTCSQVDKCPAGYACVDDSGGSDTVCAAEEEGGCSLGNRRRPVAPPVLALLLALGLLWRATRRRRS